MILETIPGLSELSPTEKLLLVSELWDDLAAHPAEIPVSPEQIAELDRRMEEYRRDPTRVTSWEKIQERILGRRHRAASCRRHGMTGRINSTGPTYD